MNKNSVRVEFHSLFSLAEWDVFFFTWVAVKVHELKNKQTKTPKKQTNKNKPKKNLKKELQLFHRATSDSWRPPSEKLWLERLDFNQMNFIENLESERNGSYNIIYLDNQRETHLPHSHSANICVTRFSGSFFAYSESLTAFLCGFLMWNSSGLFLEKHWTTWEKHKDFISHVLLPAPHYLYLLYYKCTHCEIIQNKGTAHNRGV